MEIRSEFTTMTKHNDFTEQTRFIFLDDNYWECWGCGANHSNCLHHIFGRGIKEGPEKSPLNAAQMGNFECHLSKHGYWTTASGRKELLTKTINYLSNRGYTLTEQDNAFLEKYGLEIKRLGLQL